MAREEISDESLWKLFESSTNDLLSQSVINKTKLAAEAVISHKSRSERKQERKTDRSQSPLVHTTSPSEAVSKPPVKSYADGVSESPSLNTSSPQLASALSVDEPKSPTGDLAMPTNNSSSATDDAFVPHVLDTVAEESSRESVLSTNIVKVKIKDVREIVSPLETRIHENQDNDETTPQVVDRNAANINSSDDCMETISALMQPENYKYTGSIPGGVFVTVEKHTLDGATTSKHVSSTPLSANVKLASDDLDKVSQNASSSFCQSSFDIPVISQHPVVKRLSNKPEAAVGERGGSTDTVLPERDTRIGTGICQGRGKTMLTNPQLMGQDVQVRQYEQSARQTAVRHLQAKQCETRVPKNTYSVPVKRVVNSDDLRAAGTASGHSPTSPAISGILPTKNITIQHELVGSQFATSLMERLAGLAAVPAAQTGGNQELKEIKCLEGKLKETEVELSALKEQMSRQQVNDQNKLLMELVQSQKNLNSQLLGLRSLEHPKSRLAREVVYNPLETPAPRSKLPAAAEREESPTGFMEQVVRSYPSPMSPQKPHHVSRSAKCFTSPGKAQRKTSPPSSPERRLAKNRELSPATTQRNIDDVIRREKLQTETNHQLHLLQDKVDRLVDEQRMQSLQVEQGLRRSAPIDRYLNDVRTIKEANSQVPVRNSLSQAKLKSAKKAKKDDLDVTFVQEEAETVTLATQIMERLAKLRKRKQLSEDNMATVMALRERDQAYLNIDDEVCNEEARLRKLVKSHLDRAEADVKIDFIPKPLHDVNVASTQPPIKYKTAAQRLKAIQAKIDTGIARKPKIPVNKENEPLDLYKDENYIRRVYGKALYHSQRRTIERAKPDPPTRPVPFKKTTGKTVKSEKSQTKEDKSSLLKKGTMLQKHKPTNQVPVSSMKKITPKATVCTGVSPPQAVTPTTVLGSGMRIELEDHTKMVFDVLPLSQSELRTQSTKSDVSGGSADDTLKSRQRKQSPVTVDKAPSSPASLSESDANVNSNAKSDRDVSSGADRKQEETEDSVTSEWQESVEDSASQQPALVMTADSLDLSAVTPVAAQTKKGQEGQGKSHSTPIDAADQSYLGLHQPPPRVWEEFANNPPQQLSLDDKSRSDDILTPPASLPGYQYRQNEQVPAAKLLQTPAVKYQELYGGVNSRQVGAGASKYPPEQWNVDPVSEKPLYDPTEMATRDWLEQRLMSKCIERMIKEYPLRKPISNTDPTHGDGGGNSETGSVDNTLIAGAMGEGGVAQVYIDAGRPIKTQQVKDVMRECLAEKIRTMLGTREMLDRTPGDVIEPQARQSEGKLDNIDQSEKVSQKAELLFQPEQRERVRTPEKTPPTTPPAQSVSTKLVAHTPEPSPPSSLSLEASYVDGGSGVLGQRGVRRQKSDVETAGSRMPSTPLQLSRQNEDNKVNVQEEVIPPSPAPPAVLPAAAGAVERLQGQEEKLHLSQVSLWDTLSAAQTQDSVLDEEPPFEMRYSIETPEPTPPSSPPQAVSVQTSLTEQVLQAKLAATKESVRRSESVATSLDVSRYLEESRPQTPQRRPPSITQTPEVIRVAPAQSPAALNQSASALNQSAGSQVVAVQSEPDVSSSTVTETQMNTVSEGEWVLKSDGQLTPRGEETLADLSLASTSDEEQPPAQSCHDVTDHRATVVHVKSQDEEVEPSEHSHSEGEILGPPKTNPLVALLSKLGETPKAFKSLKVEEEGEYIVGSSSRRGDVKTDADHTLHLSDLANTSHGKAKRQLLGNIESNKSSSSSGGFAFADSKQVTMRPQQLQQAVSDVTVSHPATPQAANHVTPSRSSSVKRPVPGMIQSTLDSSRKSRPTSSLRTTGEFSQMSNLPTASFSQTRESVDSPDRMQAEALLRSGGYLTNTYADTTSDVSAHLRSNTVTPNTQQLLARTIDTQGLSTGVSTALLDTNLLLADTLDRQPSGQPWGSEVRRSTRDSMTAGSGTYNVTESVDSVSSGGILRTSNEYTRTLTGTPSANKPRQYLRFSVPTGDEETSQSSDNISEINF
ncbi:hypothetical protein EB796_013277 [Bugula neritina]|uniref:Uncharacterized protein n=1 Tax=Bugula neritina TaxID=10212 RepID=A0A7J7JSI0_BUGNE|nr:hypothetical protein EB796_013277 [Bugula neritina]